MARIHPDLLKKIRKKLGINDSRAYALIAEKAGALYLPRNVAALQLASENGININKRAYATDAEREQLRSALGGRAAPTPVALVAQAQAQSAPRRTRAASASKRPRPRKSNSVMVVYGRDARVSEALFTFLRTIGLEPIEWSQARKKTGKPSPYTGEIVDAAFSIAAAVVVLLTPDDEAYLKKEFWDPTDEPFEKEPRGQARPNVLFEAGRAFGSHPEATVIVQLGNVRPFSDTVGKHVIRLNQGPECRKELASRLEDAGCAVNLSGAHWLTAGDFSPHGRPSKKPVTRRR